MINYNPKAWFTLITHNYSRHVMKTLTPVMLALTVFSLLVCFLMITVFRLHEAEFQSTTAMHSLLGIVLGLFLVFRTNSAYDRWWEGRKLWGSMVNSTRNFALKINAYLEHDEEHKPHRLWFAQMIPNFVYASKEHLRAGVQITELDITDDADLNTIQEAKHKPNRISSLLYQRINDLYRKKKITGDQLINLDKELKDFTDIIGACERIRNTPIPYSYSMFLKKFIFIYIVTLPFGFVTLSGYMTVPIVVLISYVILSVELIAEEIEDPFGRDVNDLPTDDLSGKIKDNIREILLA
ncbi:MAG: bestrophin family protein [Bacteroidota bacterium]